VEKRSDHFGGVERYHDLMHESLIGGTLSGIVTVAFRFWIRELKRGYINWFLGPILPVQVQYVKCAAASLPYARFPFTILVVCLPPLSSLATNIRCVACSPLSPSIAKTVIMATLETRKRGCMILVNPVFQTIPHC